MANQLYQKNEIIYGFRADKGSNKWAFQMPSGFVFLTKCPNGIETAHKVAAQVSGAHKRTKGNGLDNLARTQISKLVGV